MSEGKRKRLVDALREKVLDSGIARRIAYGVVTNKWVVIAAAIADSLAIYYLTTSLPHPLNLVLGAFVVVGTFLVLFYFRALKRVGLIPVSDDLAFILVHMRCLVTGNPPLTTLFARIGEAPFYKRRYSGLFQKLRGLIKNWGYSAPEALKLVSREAPSKVDEMFLQRFSAIVATGGDVKEYLRIEYNTLFAEYLSAFNRVINVLRVVFGVYTTVMGALVFMMANLMLLGMLFGGISVLLTTGALSIGFALMGMAVLMYAFTRRPLFESKPKRKNRLVLLTSFSGLMGTLVLAMIIAYLIISLKIFDMDYVALSLVFAGLALLPAAVLVKIHEGRISEYDTFFPAFVRSYGEHMAVLPNMIESLKPLLIAELGKLKDLLKRIYARLVNRVDPRVAWSLFADESSSELVTRGTHIFVDTIEGGGDLAEAGTLLSDHVNELLRLRANYLQVFKTFEITLYLMHIIAVILLIFVGSFLNVFSSVITRFAQSMPSEYAGILGFFNISPVDVSFITNAVLILMTIANALAFYSTNPGSRYAIFYYLSILLISTGMAVYAGSFVINELIKALLQPL